MKKLLALVLALVMTLSLCTISNAAFTDAKDVDASYEEAVAVLNGMGVFKGYEDGSFKPEGSITRAEVAAIVYRLYTGDVKDKQAGLYAGYGKFDDMAGAAWAAGYVGFCANAGFVKGYGNGKFGPSDPVTGYQALAMILRAVGYGKNGEFEGADWELHVAQIAQQLKVLKNVKGVSLKAAASRELVAELLFQVAANVDTVEYTPAFGYVSNTVVTAKAETLGWKNFDLVVKYNTADKWGRPSHTWTYNTGDKKTVVADKAVATYTAAVTQCDIASDLDLKKATPISVYDNGLNNVTWTIVPTATTVKQGAQGQLIEIYNIGTEADPVYRAVVIDTYLAKVTDVKDITYDAAGHQKTNATITLTTYGTTFTGLTDTEDNFPYVKNDYVLVNVHKADVTKSDIVGVASSSVGTQTTIWYNAKQHTIDGTTYNDAWTYNLNEAGFNGSKPFTWFFDSYGNVIGSAAIATAYKYGVITDMWYVNDSATGTGSIVTNVTYVDGTTATVTLNSIKVDGATTATKFAYANSESAMGPITNSTLYVSMDKNVNVTKDTTYGIIGGHMFQFETLSNGKVNAVEVTAGLTENGTAVERAGESTTNNHLKQSVSEVENNKLYVNSDTVFLVQNVSDAGVVSYETYTGFNNVPTFNANAKIDYVSNDADLYAEYVYVIGTKASATSSAFIWTTADNYSATLKTDANGVNYYEFTYGLKMDGTTSTIKVKDTEFTAVITTMLTNGANKLYKVDYTGEYATAATLVPTAPATVVVGDLTATALGNDAYVNADALRDISTGTVYNVTTATVVIGGTLADIETPGKDVYIIDDSRTANYVDYIYIASHVTTAAEAAAALTGATWSNITVSVATGANIDAYVLAQVNAKLAAAGITGVTATLNSYPAVAPTAGTTGTVWFQIDLVDGTGATASVGGQTVIVTNNRTAAAIQTAMVSAIEGISTVTDGMTEAAAKAAIKTAMETGVSGLTVTNVTIVGGSLNTHDRVQVTVTGTADGQTVTATANVTVQ